LILNDEIEKKYKVLFKWIVISLPPLIVNICIYTHTLKEQIIYTHTLAKKKKHLSLYSYFNQNNILIMIYIY
jgi:hypothetical protein